MNFKLLNDLTNLRNIFKKFDASRKGHLTSSEFKDLLKFCQLSVSLDDLYMMFSEYDPDLKGIFNYELFIRSLIDKSIMVD
jgi:Ca2+-binding EF-hand superfamily protein